MIREIIDQADSIVTLLLPTDTVGKRVEVIAFEIDGEKNALTKAQMLAQIQDLTVRSLTDLSGFKFNRDEANNYDE
ncbi:hypothetical protein [Mucilaginibacter pankratovii]|nr:hypothetical protein [Mucilaginibacter pankratovii]